MQTFSLTARQREAMRVISGPARHAMLFGGSRSGKTFLLVRAVVLRALKAEKSRHAILRFRFNAVKQSIIYDTFPKVMQFCFPGARVTMNRTDWFAEFDNGSQIWFGGLDDKERTEKILGNEYATIYLNECSQIPQGSRDLVVTRLAQAAVQKVGDTEKPLIPRMLYDCNPPSKAHWTYRLFVEKRDPDTKQAIRDPDDYVSFQINPKDNAANLAAGYLQTLEGLSARLRRRFLDGNFADATPNQLFKEEDLDRWRVIDQPLPDMLRIVVAVDPSGADDENNTDNDAIGIVVCGIGTDGNGYVLEDCTVKAGPATWGKVATDAYERHKADKIVGETNYGGAMVRFVIQAARPKTPYGIVTATRGKVVRAEPISALFETGKARLVGYLRDLEDELVAFSTVGYMGEGSPNRADAMVWALTELFPGMTKAPKAEEAKPNAFAIAGGNTGWMA